MRRPIVWLITFVGGLFFLLEFLLPAQASAWLGEAAPEWLRELENPLTPYLGVATNFLIIVGTMAFLLGPFNLVRRHVATLARRHKGALESGVFLVFLAAGFAAAALQDRHRVAEVAYNALFYGILFAFWTSSMALLSFYLVSAAYRAFRLNSVDAGLMMAAATVVLLGQVPVGDWMTLGLPEWLTLKAWAQWVLLVPNTAVQRAVLIGACGGAFATGLRHWLSLGTRASQ